jgi:hypothetical protein
MQLLLLLAGLCPVFGQARSTGADNYADYTEQREQLLGDLKLSSGKAKAFMSVAGHWDQIRQGLIEGIKKDEADLETALAPPQPDENKINYLVNALIAAHDQLFESFKSQRQEEMALLTPIQRGRFLLALKKRHEQQLCR